MAANRPEGELIIDPIQIARIATIVSFRTCVDLAVPAELNRLICRVTTFKGTILGTTSDGFDVVAAFNTEAAAEAFLRRYLDGEDEPIGCHVIAQATI